MEKEQLKSVRHFVEEFERLGGNGTVAPPWLVERRESALSIFKDAGFPTTKVEAWRFTDVRPIARRMFAVVGIDDRAAVERSDVEPYLLGSDSRICAVFVNGNFRPELSTLDPRHGGVTVASLRSLLPTDGQVVEHHLSRYASDAANSLTALSTAFLRDGALVHVDRDVALDEPIQLLFLAKPEPGLNQVWHPRTLIVVEEGARASVVESYVALSDGEYWTNAVTEVAIDDNAELKAYRVQRESTEAYHTAATHSRQGRDSRYYAATFVFGGALTRHDISAVLDGEGGEATLNGLSLVTSGQHVDHHTLLEHARPHCNSWEYFNGVYDDHSRGVFNGRIIVRPGAQKTDSKQTSNNLLLSPDARADSQPQLEIYADDVKCTHGATLGPIDERQLFYLQSRGLNREDARSLLTYGFAAEILRDVEHEELRGMLDRIVRSFLTEGARKRIASEA